MSARVDVEVKKRLAADTLLVREIGDKIEAVFWTRMKWTAGVLAIVGAVIAFLGYDKWTDLTQQIVTAGKPALEKAAQAKAEADTAKAEVDAVLSGINQTRREADAAKASLSARVAAISISIDRASDDANRKLASISGQVQGVVAQTQAADVMAEFPLLGKTGVLSLGGIPWNPQKRPGDKWIRLTIDGANYSHFDPQRVKALAADLSHSGFTIITKWIGRTEPNFAAVTTLSDWKRNEVIAAHPTSVEIAKQAQEIASKYFKFDSGVLPVMAQLFGEDQHWVVDHEPSDAEISLVNP